jgi:hypothetical protein
VPTTLTPIDDITRRKDRSMKNLLLRLASLFSGLQRRSPEDHYLAQSVDAQDFEVRQRALERARP